MDRKARIESAIKALERLASDPKSQEAALEVMTYLGNERAVEAVSVLAKHLSISRQHWTVSGPQALLQRYPAIGALVQIGPSAVVPVLEAVVERDNPETVPLAAEVVRDVLGDALAVRYLELQIEAQTDPAKKTRLQALAKQMEDNRRFYGPREFGKMPKD